MREFTRHLEGARFKAWEMPFNQMEGPHISVPQTLSMMPLENLKDYDNYIARLKNVPMLMRGIEASMTLGVRDGRVAPKLLCEQGLREVTMLATAKPEDTPFASPIKKNMPAGIGTADSKRIREQIMDVIARTVQPAYERFGRYLTQRYIPHARVELGIVSIPDSDAYYAFLIRNWTTTNHRAEEIHRLGLEEVRRDEAEMLFIARKLGYSDLKTFNAAIKANPKLHPASEQQLIDVYSGYLDGMRRKLPEYFRVLPKARLVVLPIPAFRAPSGPPAYFMRAHPMVPNRENSL